MAQSEFYISCSIGKIELKTKENERLQQIYRFKLISRRNLNRITIEKRTQTKRNF